MKDKYDRLIESVVINRDKYGYIKSVKYTDDAAAAASNSWRRGAKFDLRKAKKARRKLYREFKHRRTGGSLDNWGDELSKIGLYTEQIKKIEGKKASIPSWFQIFPRLLTAEAEVAKLAKMKEQYDRLSEYMDIEAFVKLADESKATNDALLADLDELEVEDEDDDE